MTTTLVNAATREEWLERAVAHMRPWFEAVNAPIPDPVRVACGWPGRGGLGKVIGQCWSASCSSAGICEIFVSPRLAEPTRAAGVLLHECIHAAVGLECGHKGEFKRVALALGLEGKMTATTEGEALTARLTEMLRDIGPYPHAALDPKGKGGTSGPKKQGTRMLKAECPACGYIARITAKWMAFGLPTCVCGEPMVASTGEGAEE